MSVVDIECSTAVPCPGITFSNFHVQTPNDTAPIYKCIDVVSESGLSGKTAVFFVVCKPGVNRVE